MPKTSLAWDQQRLLERIIRDDNPGDAMASTLKKTSGEAKPSVFSTGSLIALKFLEQEEWRSALRVLEPLLEHYLWGDLRTSDQGIGEGIVKQINLIARAWTTAHANSLLTREPGPREFDAPLPGYFTNIWSSQAVRELKHTGELSDLETIGWIGKKCGEAGLERSCGESLRNIATREAVRFALSELELNVMAKFIKKPEELAIRQLVKRIETLFHGFSLDTLIAGMGRGAGAQVTFGPMDSLYTGIGFERLYSSGIGRRFSIYIGSTHLDADPVMSRFLLENKLATKHRGKPFPEFELTESGKELVQLLMRTIFGIQTVEGQLPARMPKQLGPGEN
jgi:hypothetical protein